MRIFYIADGVSLSSKVGDIVHVTEFVNVLSKKGIQVALLIRGGRPSKELQKGNVVLFRIPSWCFPLSAFSYFTSIVAILFIIALYRPKLVYVRDTGINLGAIIGKLLQIPVFLEVNGDLMSEYSTLSRSLLFFINQLMHFTYSSAEGVIIPSENQISILTPHNVKIKRVLHAPNGVNPSLFRPLNKDTCKIRIGLGGPLHFCFVGHLTKWQGVDNAILAFSELLKENPDLKLVIVGDGSFRKNLESLTLKLGLQDHVMFLGSFPHSYIPYVINACDVCIAPFTAFRNKKVGVSPLKLYEYLSCGKPVIASAIFGTEIIEKLDAGILVEPDNVEDLRSAFERAIEMLPHWEENADALHEEIAQTCSWDSRVEKILEALNRLSAKT